MNKQIRLLMVAVLCGVVSVSCERTSKDLGGVPDKGIGTPDYVATASVTLPSGVSHIAEVAPSGKPAVLDGGALYATHCAACHQVNGKGVPGAFPPLDESPYVTSENTERLAGILVYGLMGPITVLGTTYNNVMPGLGQTLKNNELAAIASYIRGSWSNSAPPVPADVFQGVRDKWAQRAMFTIGELGEEVS